MIRARKIWPLVICTLMASSIAHAETDPEPLAQWHAELGFGPYQPKVSTNTENRAFYDLMYASGEGNYLFDNKPMMTTLGMAQYLWSGFGLLGYGLRIGFWNVTGNARLCQTTDAEGTTTSETCTSDTVADSVTGNTTTKLAVLPLSVDAIYRIDYLRRTWAIPVEFYIKAGVDYYFWWSSTGGEAATYTLSDGTTEAGQGGTVGFHGTVGISLNLDWIEPRTAARARTTSNMAGTHLYFEASQIVADGFGVNERLNMSALHCTMGIGLDFF